MLASCSSFINRRWLTNRKDRAKAEEEALVDEWNDRFIVAVVIVAIRG